MRTRIALAVGAAAAVAAIVVVVATRSSSEAVTSPPVLNLPPSSDFVANVDHPFFPLSPGTTFTYVGQQEGQPRKVTVFVAHKTRMILGIAATVVLDQVFVDGQPEEKTWDWYAQDDRGNVRYLGENSLDFVNGKWERSDGSWEAGVDGAKAGLIMEAEPQVGDVYRQEYYAGHAEDMADVIDVDASATVPYGNFQHALVTKEGTPLEKSVVEHKYYVHGVGNVRTIMVKGGSEEEKLVSVAR
jgi:hypothetical protein